MGNRRHPWAKLTVEGRMLLVHRVVDLGWPRARAAEAQGCSAATVGKWLGRFEQEGAAGLVDRCSRPRRSPNRMPEAVEEQILEYRTRHRVGAHHIADALGVAQSTVSAVLARRGAPLLRHLDGPTGTPVRYERDRPGELVHVDVKKQGRIPDGGGWRVHGRAAGVGRVREQRRRKGSGVKLAMTSSTSPWTTTPGWPTSRCRTTNAATPPRRSCNAPAPGSPPTASSWSGC